MAKRFSRCEVRRFVRYKNKGGAKRWGNRAVQAARQQVRARRLAKVFKVLGFKKKPRAAKSTP